MLTSIFGNWRNHAENAQPMSPALYVTYFVLSRIAWPLGIAWIIFSCYKGLAPFVDSILSWRWFYFFCSYIVYNLFDSSNDHGLLYICTTKFIFCN